MSVKPILAAAMAVTMVCPAVAQEFSGGELGLEYNLDPSDSGNGDASYSAGVEFSFGREYAISVTAKNLDLNDSSSATNLTLHGLYHVNPGATVGLFYSRDDDDLEGYGIEGGTVVGLGEIGGYIGQRSFGGANATIIGFESRSKVADQIIFFTDFDIVTENSVGRSTSEIGVSYEFDQGPEAYFQVGRQAAFGDEDTNSSDTYVGIGARISFGAKRGTTFESR